MSESCIIDADTNSTNKFATLCYELPPYRERYIGQGSFSNVFKVKSHCESQSSPFIALKTSRVSIKVKRPTLQYEARILHLLQGHTSIPPLYGYGQLEHFEYIAMELQGANLKDRCQDGAGFVIPTVVRIVDQILAGIEHIHSHGIIHRDIKPTNLLCALNESDPTIKIIDFGLSKPFSMYDQPSKCDLLKEQKTICGTVPWASLNAHSGLDLSLRDDLESLAFTALFLLRGNLPWELSRRNRYSQLQAQEIVKRMKISCSVEYLCESFPDEFGHLLTYSRSLHFNQLPDYPKLACIFKGLAGKLGISSDGGPLDWTPCRPRLENPPLPLDDDGIDLIKGRYYNAGDDDAEDEDSYFELDIADWDHRQLGDRDQDLTLPAELKAEFDRCTPRITRVLGHGMECDAEER